MASKNFCLYFFSESLRINFLSQRYIKV